MKSIEKMKGRIKFWLDKAQWFNGSEVEGHSEMRHYCQGVAFGIKNALDEIEKEIIQGKIKSLLDN